MYKVKIKYEHLFQNNLFMYLLNGQLHNSMGPAIERYDTNHREVREWWLYGKKYEFEEWYKIHNV